MRQNIGPAARNDPQYILLLSSVVAELQRRITATIVYVSAAYKTNNPGEVVLVDAAGGAVTVTLPPVKQFYGQIVQVKKMDNSGNAVAIAAQAGQTIDGAASISITSQYNSFTLLSTGTEWVIV